MTPQQILLIIFARRYFAAAIFVITALGGTAVTLLMPRMYTASTSLFVDVKVDPIAGALMPTVGSPAYMTTQTEIIQSDRVAIGVVRLLRIDQNPQLVEQWREATDGKTPLENHYASLLRKGLLVNPTRGSNIITLSYSGRDPKFATAVANAYAQAYIDLAIDLRVEPARQYAAWFDERMKVLRSNFEKAQAKLSAYQKEKGIVASDERLDQETARFNALMVQLAEAQAQKADTSSRQKSSGSEHSPDVQQSPLIQGIKADLAKAEARLSEISKNVGINHPQYQQLAAQIAGIKQQLHEETRRISGGAATATRVSVQREEELKAIIEAQKKQVLALRAERDEIAVMVRDVETAQRAYETVSQRMSQLTLESKTEQANVHILSPAIEPVEPARPNIPRYILGSLIAGILVGMAAALGLEFIDRRVRNAADIAVEGVPVLGVLAPRTVKYTFRERVNLVRAYIANRRRRRSAAAAIAAGEA